MSDCKTIYRKVNEFVHCLYPGELQGSLLRNMNTLSAMITGIILCKDTQLPQIALNVPEPIKLPSTEKRFKRLIINEKVDEQIYFLPFIQRVLANLALEEMVLAIDGSLVGRGCTCLMISLIYKNRALPLVFSIVNGTELQQTLDGFGWKYVSRTSSNITIYINEEPFQIQILPAMLPKGHCRGRRNCQITHKKYGPVTAVAWWGDDQKEPLFLVTNFLSASKACDYYAMRFTIETFFSDQKSRGFNIDKSHLSCPKRLTRLMYASCLAYLWIIFFWYLGIGDRFVQTYSPNGSV
jgi:hypothetical protein